MGETSIQVRELGKRYPIGAVQEGYGTLRDTIASVVRSPLARIMNGSNHSGNPEEIWALRDLSFEVKKGEVLGIIGRNGAGKSTLLKILSRVTYPTVGEVDIRGRVSSLLEVGTGFHPELTGRENIFLNGAILGMKRSEIQRKFDEIVDFAEIEQFLDTPVKRYSSGMYMRLAFAVAAHLEPEILIVDEVLAVGDAAFQKKSLGKMDDVSRQGRTVLFVSHNLLAVENLCNCVLYLEGGKIIERGDPRRVISTYIRNTLSLATERFWEPGDDENNSAGVRLYSIRVRPTTDENPEAITIHTPLSLEFDYWNTDPTACLKVCFSLYNQHGVLLFDSCSPIDMANQQNPSPQGLLRTICQIPGDLLNDGLHRVDLIILSKGAPLIRESHALVFNVQDSPAEREDWYGDWPGAVRPSLKWETSLVQTLPGQKVL